MLLKSLLIAALCYPLVQAAAIVKVGFNTSTHGENATMDAEVLPPRAAAVNPKFTCDVSYALVMYQFDIRGKDFEESKFDRGYGLKHHISHCGALTAWKFKMTPDDPEHEWHATGNLPLGAQSCIQRSISAAGGPNIATCQGPSMEGVMISPRAEAVEPRYTCGVYYNVLWDRFFILGKNFNATEFDHGNGLKKEISICGLMTAWKFTKTPTDPVYQWHASGNLPIGNKNCVQRAMGRAGGPNGAECAGNG